MSWGHRLGAVSLAVLLSAVLLLVSLLMVAPTLAFDEEDGLAYYEPLSEPRTSYTPSVSSVHFDLVGALAVAAGFSVTDAATIQIYSQLTDSSLLPGANPRHSFDATSYPTPPPLSSVITNTHCPSPATTAPTVSIGAVHTDLTECYGCFTSRWGPYGVFFHFPHDRPDELGAIRRWAYGDSAVLTGMVIYGYSSTARSTFSEVANIYNATSCFISRTVTVDTGSVVAGSLEAFGIYLHSLGDHWSHGECLAAADADGKLFAAHVTVTGQTDPLWACRWTMHMAEFGNPNLFPESRRSFSGTLAIYDALAAYSVRSGRALYRPIPLSAEGGYLTARLWEFVRTPRLQSQRRRDMTDDLKAWALATQQQPQYQRRRLYLPTLARG